LKLNSRTMYVVFELDF